MGDVEVEGVRLFYERAGSGLTVLVPAACWLERDLEFLAEDYDVVFYDQRNRGRSDRSADISIDREVDDLEAVRVALGLGPVVTIGWSYLGAVVALHARRYPAAVRGVVMVAPMAPRQGVPEYHVSDDVIASYRSRWAPVAEKLARIDEAIAIGSEDDEALWRERQRVNSAFRMGDPEAIDRMRSEPWRHQNERPDRLNPVFEALFDGLESRDWRIGLSEVTAPVLIFHGLADGPAAMSKDWNDSLPYAQTLFWEGVGHFPFLERPTEFRQAIVRFLSDVAADTGSASNTRAR
jgi:proline iminopeptidase